MSDDEGIDFPVGDDPNDPEVLVYWTEVVKRLRMAPLPEEYASWAEAIQDRIDEFHRARRALAGDPESSERARRDYHSAVFEFERVKWKLSSSFRRGYKLNSPAILALFAKVSRLPPD